MACKIETGIINDCSDLLRVGGISKTFWIGYLSELSSQFDLTQAGDISTISFGAYGGLRRFDGNKFSHSFGSELVVSAGGNKSYKQTFAFKILTNSTADDLTLEDLNLGNDIFVIVQDNNQKFYIIGAGNGLSVLTDVQNSGVTGDSDATDSVTLEGQELTKPLRFLDNNYQDTLDFLVSVEI